MKTNRLSIICIIENGPLEQDTNIVLSLTMSSEVLASCLPYLWSFSKLSPRKCIVGPLFIVVRAELMYKWI
jgi:hypothetical protein